MQALYLTAPQPQVGTCGRASEALLRCSSQCVSLPWLVPFRRQAYRKKSKAPQAATIQTTPPPGCSRYGALGTVRMRNRQENEVDRIAEQPELGAD